MPDYSPMQEHRPRSETRELIIMVLQTSEIPLSRMQIARAIKRQKSQNITSMIDELLEEGLIERGVKTYHNKVQGYVYWWKK
jgi:predicted transcriptional regulator